MASKGRVDNNRGCEVGVRGLKFRYRLTKLRRSGLVTITFADWSHIPYLFSHFCLDPRHVTMA